MSWLSVLTIVHRCPLVSRKCSGDTANGWLLTQCSHLPLTEHPCSKSVSVFDLRALMIHNKLVNDGTPILVPVNHRWQRSQGQVRVSSESLPAREVAVPHAEAATGRAAGELPPAGLAGPLEGTFSQDWFLPSRSQFSALAAYSRRVSQGDLPHP